jgi:hypothetical protein
MYKLRETYEEGIAAYFKVFSHHLTEKAKENNKKFQ